MNLYLKIKETSATKFRRNPDYYSNELKQNAERSRSKNYYKLNPDRAKQIQDLHHKYQSKTGSGRKHRAWQMWEIDFLKEFYGNMSGIEIAEELERSWSSVHHKVERLGLRLYNKYI